MRRRPTEWREQATCWNNPDAELLLMDQSFQPGKGRPPRTTEDLARLGIRLYCDRCPVTAECLAYGMATRQPFGVFGGLTKFDRDRLRKEEEREMVAAAGSLA